MNEKINVPRNKKDLIDLINLDDEKIIPAEADMDRAWLKVKTVIQEKKKESFLSLLFQKLIPSYGFGFSAIAAAAVLIITGIYLSSGFKSEHKTAYFSRFNNGLILQRDGRIQPLDKNLSIKNGDRIRNEGSTPISLTYPGKFIVALPSNSQIVFNSLSDKNNLKTKIQLINGSADFHVRKLEKGDNFEVMADSNTISVVGTVFRVNRVQQKFEIATEEGRVEVTGKDSLQGKVVVPAGKELQLTENGKSIINPINKNTSEELHKFAASEELQLSNKTAMLIINTPEFNSKVYINSQFLGNTPAGLTIKKDQPFDLEIVGDNGSVYRNRSLKLSSDKTLSIDLKKPQSFIPLSFTGKLITKPYLQIDNGILSVSAGKDGWIYQIQSQKLIKLPLAASAYKLPPVIEKDKVVLIDNGEALAFDNSGHMIWKLAIHGTLWYDSILTHNDSFFALSTVDRGVFIFDQKGKLLSRLDAWPGYSSPALDSGNILYYIDNTGSLTAYAVREDRNLWKIKELSDITYPIQNLSNLIITFFRDNGKIEAYTKSNGLPAWKINIDETVRKDISIQANNDNLLICMNNNGTGKLWLIDAHNGAVSRTITLPKEVDSIALTDKEVWISTKDLLLTAYDLKTLNSIKVFHSGQPALDMKFWKNSLWLLTEKGIEELRE